MTITEADRARFEKFLRRDEATGCLLWTGTVVGIGHGRFYLGGRNDTELAHRVAWVMAGRVITPEKPWILHNCPRGDQPACCEIAHLWDGTRADNMRDMARKGRGSKSARGLPFGVFRQKNGRFGSSAWIGGKQQHFGTYDTWQEASAIATLHKNLALYPDASVN